MNQLMNTNNALIYRATDIEVKRKEKLFLFYFSKLLSGTAHNIEERYEHIYRLRMKSLVY